MQKLEILIEENAFGSVRPVEVVADAPVFALVPALVEELKLPQKDLFGKKLTYVLRHTAGGSVLPEHSTLLASGIVPGERLTLDAYDPDIADWNAPAPFPQAPAPINSEATLHSSATVADFSALPQSNTLSATLPAGQQGRKKLARRTFLTVGAAVLGVAGTGLGYAAYQKYLSGLHFTQPAAHPNTAKTTNPIAPQPMIPTAAKLQTTFTKHQQLVRSVAWSPDGTMLASGADDTRLFLWGPDGAVHTMLNHPASVRTVAWSPDGKRLVSGSGTQVAFFDAQHGNMLARSTHRHTQMITSIAWATHGLMQVVSAGMDMRAIVWDTTNYQAQTVYRLHNAPIEAVSWSGDGLNVASSSQGGYVRVWAATSGLDLHGHYQDANLPMRALAFSPTTMRLAVGGNDGIIRFWNALTCQAQQGNGAACTDVPQRLRASQKAIRALAWSPDGRFLAVGAEDGMLTLWDLANPRLPLLKVQQNTTVHSITWSPDSKYLASAAANTVSTWLLV